MRSEPSAVLEVSRSPDRGLKENIISSALAPFLPGSKSAMGLFPRAIWVKLICWQNKKDVKFGESRYLRVIYLKYEKITMSTSCLLKIPRKALSILELFRS